MAIGLELDRLSALVDAWSRHFLDEVGISVEPLRGMIAYHLGWAGPELRPLETPAAAGKRLRPALCLLVADAVGADRERAAAPAVAVELVHNFSLVHDDIQDRSDLRRHRPTVWKLWGVAQAINVGDGLFALAQLALCGELGRGTPMEVLFQAVTRLNRTCLALVEGQFLDLELQQAPRVTLAEYQQMVDGKTAALFRCAAELGALYGGASAQTVAAYGDFGFQLGRAFQYQDDLLGAWGEPKVTGKPGATDLSTKKKGLPAALAYERLAGAEADRFRQLYASASDLTEAEVEELQSLLERAGVRRASEELVARGYAAALQALRRAAAPGQPSALLEQLCQALHARRT